ncbi:hydrophobic surface binding protein A-domain-containing protein [Phaeosphaeriaceae sp. PMI808]|nr:hydrophobic surface binding protein A-domain-containing protein [Phaeosphaeriaceae sp. PMI808]
MRYSLFFLSLLSISSAVPVVPRDGTESRAPELLATIKDLGAAVPELTTAVNKFDGSLLGFLPQVLAVVGAETKLDATVLKATYIASSSGNFTAAESTEVVQTLATQIGPIQASLDALKAKYPVFKKKLISPVVLLDLKILKKHTGGLIDAVSQKVTPDVGGLLVFGSSILNQAFDDAIAVYQG